MKLPDGFEEIELDLNQFEIVGSEQPQREVDNQKLQKSILEEREFDDERAEGLATLYLADKTKQDPISTGFEPMARAHFGIKDEESINGQKALELIKGSIFPEEEKEEQLYHAFHGMDEEQKYKETITNMDMLVAHSGMDVSPEPTKEASAEERKKAIAQHSQKLFRESKALQIKYANRRMSDKAKQFAKRSLFTGEPNLLAYEALTVKDQQYASMYMSAANPKLVRSWSSEIGTRIANKADQSLEGFKATEDNFAKFIGGASYYNDVLYQEVKQIFGDDLTLNGKPIFENGEFVEEAKVKLKEKFPEFMYETNESRDANASKWQVRSRKTQWEFIDGLTVGKREFDRKKALRTLRNLSYEQFAETGIPKKMVMGSVDMGFDLAAVMASSAMAGPVGGMSYSAGRFYGDFADTLVIDHGVDFKKAQGIALLTTVPYVAIEYMQGKGLTDAMTKKVMAESRKGIAKEVAGRILIDATVETLEEVAQTSIEITAKIAAREWADAEGITNEALIKEWKDTFIESLYAMPGLAAVPNTIRGGRQFLNFSDIERTDSIAKGKLTEEQEAQFDAIREDNGKIPEEVKSSLFSAEGAELESLVAETNRDYETNFTTEFIQEEKQVEQEATETYRVQEEELTTQANNEIEETLNEPIPEASQAIYTEEQSPVKETDDLEGSSGVGFERIKSPIVEFIKDQGGIMNDDHFRSEVNNFGGGVNIYKYTSKESGLSWDQMLKEMQDQNIVDQNFDVYDMIDELSKGEYREVQTDGRGDDYWDLEAKNQTDAIYAEEPDFDLFSLQEADQQIEAIGETIKNYATIEQVDETTHLIKGKGGAEITLKIADVAGLNGKDALGGWDAKNKTITLPSDAKTFTFTHEITHGMRDLGVIDDAQWSSLVKLARNQNEKGKFFDEGHYRAEYEKAGREFTQEDANHEYVAHMMEDWRKNGIPQDYRGLVKKVLDFVQQLLSKATNGKISKAEFYEAFPMAKDVFDGKPLESKADQLSEEVRFSLDKEIAKVEEKNLIVVHNIKPEGFAEASKEGGLFLPSLAIVRSDIGFDNYGDISLIGPPSMVDPKDHKTSNAFDADVYSPRQPRKRFEENRKILQKIEDDVHPYVERMGGHYMSHYFHDNGYSGLASSEFVQAMYLDETAKMPKIKYKKKIALDPWLKPFAKKKNLSKNEGFIAAVRQELTDSANERINSTSPFQQKRGAKMLAEIESDMEFVVEGYIAKIANFNSPKEIDTREMRDAVRKKVDEKEVTQWLEEKYPNLIKKEFFNNSNGDRKAYTFDNIIKAMKGSIRGGENYNYGPASIRAQVANEFKSLQDIKNNRDKILTSEEFEKEAEISSKKFKELKSFAETLTEKPFQSGDFAEAMNDYASGDKKAFRYLISNPPTELFTKANEFLAYLQGMPTEYFESKPQRFVNFSDFKAALVPTGKDYAETVAELKRHDVKVIRYRKSDGKNFEHKALNKVRFSLAQDKSPNRSAVVSLAKKIFVDGKNITMGDLKRMNVKEDDEMDVINKARALAKDLETQLQFDKQDQNILQEIKVAEIRQYYAEKVEDLYQRGIVQGEFFEQARQRLREDKKKLRKLSMERTVIHGIQEHIDDAKKVFEQDEVNFNEFLGKLSEDIRKDLVKEGIFTNKKKNYKSTPEFRGAYRSSLSHIAQILIRDLVPSRNKEKLIQQARELKNLSTAPSIENNATKLFNKIEGQRVKEDKNTLMKKFDNLVFSKMVTEQVPRTKELIHSKQSFNRDGSKSVKDLEPSVRRWLKLVGQSSKLSEKSQTKIVNDLTEFLNSVQSNAKAEEMIEDLQERMPALKQYKTMEFEEQAMIALRAVNLYGNLRNRTQMEIAQAILQVEGEIGGSIAKLEKLIHERAQRMGNLRRALILGILPEEGQAPSDMGKAFNNLLGWAFGLRSWLNVIHKNAKGQEATDAKKVTDDLLRLINGSTHGKDVDVMNTHNEFFDKVTEIYGRDSGKVLSELSKKNKAYDKYSNNNNTLSKLHLMQIYGFAMQEDYQTNAKIYNRDAKALEKEFDEKDKALIAWFRDYYATKRILLSEKNMQITGNPIEMNDPNYLPVKIRATKGGLPEVHQSTTIVPPSMNNRVLHGYDVDETLSILDIWLQRSSENEHYLNTVDTSIELRGVFANRDVQEAIESAFGKKSKNTFLEGIQDFINDGSNNGMKIKAIVKTRDWFTFSKFMFNARIGIKQITSVPAFGFEIGLRNTAKYASQAFTSDGIAAMKEILDSDLAKERLSMGNTEDIRHAMSTMSPTALRKVFKHAMIFNQLGDIVPTMFIGQGIYRSYTQEFHENGATMADAKKEAMSKLFEIVESTQQSGKMKDQAGWQRRGGDLGRLLSTFTNTTRQYLEKEFVAAMKLAANPNWQNAKDFGRVAAINHLILPLGYNGMNLLINMALGDEPDEDDAKMMLASLVAGPASGFIFFGSILTAFSEVLVTGKKPQYKSITPLDGLITDAQSLGGLMTADDADEAWKNAKKIIKSNVAPYREVDKAVKNYK